MFKSSEQRRRDAEEKRLADLEQNMACCVCENTMEPRRIKERDVPRIEELFNRPIRGFLCKVCWDIANSTNDDDDHTVETRKGGVIDTHSGEWTCISCKTKNSPFARVCDDCSAERPEESKGTNYTVTLSSSSEDVGLDCDIVGGAVRIRVVNPGSAAERAGVPCGILTMVNGNSVCTVTDLVKQVKNAKAGGKTTLTLRIVPDAKSAGKAGKEDRNASLLKHYRKTSPSTSPSVRPVTPPAAAPSLANPPADTRPPPSRKPNQPIPPPPGVPKSAVTAGTQRKPTPSATDSSSSWEKAAEMSTAPSSWSIGGTSAPPATTESPAAWSIGPTTTPVPSSSSPAQWTIGAPQQPQQSSASPWSAPPSAPVPAQPQKKAADFLDEIFSGPPSQPQQQQQQQLPYQSSNPQPSPPPLPPLPSENSMGAGQGGGVWGMPQPQGGYFPQQQGFAPQQQGFAPQQQGFAPQQQTMGHGNFVQHPPFMQQQQGMGYVMQPQGGYSGNPPGHQQQGGFMHPPQGAGGQGAFMQPMMSQPTPGYQPPQQNPVDPFSGLM